jgi:hypothetical protein
MRTEIFSIRTLCKKPQPSPSLIVDQGGLQKGYAPTAQQYGVARKRHGFAHLATLCQKVK